MSMTNKIEKLHNRRTDNDHYVAFSSTENSAILSAAQRALHENEIRKSIENTSLSDNEYYVFTSMSEVGDKYRNKSYTEAQKIVSALHENGIYNIDIDFQGSITNNTCIKYVSDIDLLVVITDFFSVQPPLKPNHPYQGDPLQELKDLRKKCISIIRSNFQDAKIELKSKCVSVSGGTFKRDIDVVICNWYNTVKYSKTLVEYQRGIKVLDIEKNNRTINLPFLHNKLLDDKDLATTGKYKSFVRLVKSIKSDMDKAVDISSYEIVSLLYHMNNADIINANNPYSVLNTICNHFINLYNDKDCLSTLYVPNSTVKIIESLNMSAFAELITEINDLKSNLLV